jgi:hypothetical protein
MTSSQRIAYVNHDDVSAAESHVLSLCTETESLRAQVQQLRLERDQLVDAQKKIMLLLGTDRADKILHDLRNILNERDLLKTLLDRN